MVWTSLSSLLFTSKLAFKHRPYVVELFEMRYRFICWSYSIMSILCRGLTVYFVWKFVEFHFSSDSNFERFYWLAATKHSTFNHYLILKFVFSQRVSALNHLVPSISGSILKVCLVSSEWPGPQFWLATIKPLIWLKFYHGWHYPTTLFISHFS